MRLLYSKFWLASDIFRSLLTNLILTLLLLQDELSTKTFELVLPSDEKSLSLVIVIIVPVDILEARSKFLAFLKKRIKSKPDSHSTRYEINYDWILIQHQCKMNLKVNLFKLRQYNRIRVGTAYIYSIKNKIIYKPIFFSVVQMW